MSSKPAERSSRTARSSSENRSSGMHKMSRKQKKMLIRILVAAAMLICVNVIKATSIV